MYYYHGVNISQYPRFANFTEVLNSMFKEIKANFLDVFLLYKDYIDKGKFNSIYQGRITFVIIFTQILNKVKLKTTAIFSSFTVCMNI